MVVDRVDKLKDVEAVLEPETDDNDFNQLTYKIHKTIKKVTEDIERFHLNTAIASIMELVNTIYKFLEKDRKDLEALKILKGAIETVITLLFPFVPHITEELWGMLGEDRHFIKRPWPEYKEAYVKEERVVIVVEVNGKLRDRLEVERDIEEPRLIDIVCSLDKIKRYIDGKEIKKTIVVPNKLVNIVCV
jgi:leucyl-tRNA synthetase